MEGRWRHPLPDIEVARIAADIDERGFGVVPAYVSQQDLVAAREFARTMVERSGGEYVGVSGADGCAGTVLATISASAPFVDLCRTLYERGTGRPAADFGFTQVFRCLKGATGQKHSYRFHFDSHVLTALLPIAIPVAEPCGDLLLIPNVRSIRGLYLRNVLDKVVMTNKLAQMTLRAAAKRGSRRFVRVRMQPGDMYFFWGYRSLHANEACDPDKLRATALFHYGNPHQNSRLQDLIKRQRAASAGSQLSEATADLPRRVQTK